MALPRYDILKKDSAGFVWIGAVHDPGDAKLCIKNLLAESVGEYVIFDQHTRQIVEKYRTPPDT
jgi:hypothetical protein